MLEIRSFNAFDLPVKGILLYRAAVAWSGEVFAIAVRESTSSPTRLIALSPGVSTKQDAWDQAEAHAASMPSKRDSIRRMSLEELIDELALWEDGLARTATQIHRAAKTSTWVLKDGNVVVLRIPAHRSSDAIKKMGGINLMQLGPWRAADLVMRAKREAPRALPVREPEALAEAV